MVHYRPAERDDITSVAEIYGTALKNVYKRHGFPDEKLLPRGVNPFYAFILREEPEGFFVAEDSSRIVGAAFSWKRERLWFLSHLFILPEYQGKGIGGSLLARTLDYSKASDISMRSVITMAFNVSSVSLYMKNGMFPKQSIFLCASSGKPRVPLTRNDAVSYEYADASSLRSQVFNGIDREVLGFQRPAHHHYFIEDRQIPCLLFRDTAGDPAAYAYLWPDGRIGPVAALRRVPFKQILYLAAGHASEEAATSSLMIPGANTEVLDIALDLGFRVRLPYILLSSHPFGCWDRYLLHSPGLM